MLDEIGPADPTLSIPQDPSAANSTRTPKVANRRGMKAHVRKRLREIKRLLRDRFGGESVNAEWKDIAKRLEPMLRAEFHLIDRVEKARINLKLLVNDPDAPKTRAVYEARVELQTARYLLANNTVLIIGAIPQATRGRMVRMAVIAGIRDAPPYSAEEAWAVVDLVAAAQRVDKLVGVNPAKEEGEDPRQSAVALTARDPLVTFLMRAYLDAQAIDVFDAALNQLDPWDRADLQDALLDAARVIWRGAGRPAASVQVDDESAMYVSAVLGGAGLVRLGVGLARGGAHRAAVEGVRRVFRRRPKHGGVRQGSSTRGFTKRELDLGRDPASGGKLKVHEVECATKLEGRVGKLTRDPSGKGDWIDASGRVYDGIGPVKPGFQHKIDDYIDSIRRHLASENKMTVQEFVVDVRRLTSAEVAQVERAVGGLRGKTTRTISIQR